MSRLVRVCQQRRRESALCARVRAQGVREITSIFSCWERGGERQAPAGGAGLACVWTGRWVCELPKGLHLGETAARSAAPSQPTNCERVVSDQERVGWVLLKDGPEPARAERCESWPREELSIPFGCNCRSPHVAALAEKPAGRGGLGCWEFRNVGDAETLRPPAGHPISARGFRSPPGTGNARLTAGDPSAGNGGGRGRRGVTDDPAQVLKSRPVCTAQRLASGSWDPSLSPPQEWASRSSPDPRLPLRFVSQVALLSEFLRRGS